MRTRTALAVAMAMVALLVAGLATAVTLAVTDDDNWAGHGGAMMSTGNGTLRGMHGTRVGSEYAYLVEMVAHHEEAVAAARELERSPRAEMRAFGESIVESQSAQIDQMEEWLADWYPTVRTGGLPADDARPGRPLGGPARPVFLQDMVGHHMAAVMMSQQLLAGVADQSRSRGSRGRSATTSTPRSPDAAWLRDWFGISAPMHGWAAPERCSGERDKLSIFFIVSLSMPSPAARMLETAGHDREPGRSSALETAASW